MGFSDWMNYIFGTGYSNTNNNMPSEFQLPTENFDAKIHNLEPDNYFDLSEVTNTFEESMNIFHSSFEDIFRQFQLVFPTNNDSENNIYFYPNDNFSQTPNEEKYNPIPKKNFMAKNYFLRPSPSTRVLNENLNQVIMSPGLLRQPSSSSSVSLIWNGRRIEKEVSTRQLKEGFTEKVIVLKDGNQKCITTVTENSITGEKSCNKQLFNLDESQLNEFQNRFQNLP